VTADAIRSLEERVARLEDEAAIRDLLSRYGWYADVGEHEKWVQLFAPDGAVHLLGGEPAGTFVDDRRWEGREALRGYISDPRMHVRIDGRCLHLAGINLRVRLDGDRAVATSGSLVVVQEEEGLVLYGGGMTRWELRRIDGEWTIAERRRVALGADGYEAVREA
jgi:SnoaL-like domain